MQQTVVHNGTLSARMLFWLYKIVTITILITGAGLDLVLLFYGPEPLLRYVFTTRGEIVLTIWMASALALGLAVYPHLDLQRTSVRIVQRIILVYFMLLVLMHGVNNLLLNNTAGYLATFDTPAYPYIAAVVLLSAALFTARLQQK